MEHRLHATASLAESFYHLFVNHRPSAATMTFSLTPEGYYLLTAEGLNEKGKNCSERPTGFIPDGKDHAVPDFPGLISIVTARMRIRLFRRCEEETVRSSSSAHTWYRQTELQ